MLSPEDAIRLASAISTSEGINLAGRGPMVALSTVLAHLALYVEGATLKYEITRDSVNLRIEPKAAT